MTARDPSVSGFEKLSKGDKYSIVIAMASLLVSLSALGVGVYLWINTRPADPTLIPTFGQIDQPEIIDAGEGGRRFFAFLDEHAGRKIRIIATIGDGVDIRENRGRSTYFEIPRKCPPGQECLTHKDVLNIKGTSADKPGIVYSSGDWIFDGYFANYGLLVEKQDTAERAITAMDIVTAVS